MLGKRKKAFANPNEALLYNTSVVATIKTVSEEPIYAKLYPYPMGAADFVNSEIQELLKNGIIQKSKSPNSNPIWAVDKKGTDEAGNRKMRLVLDFRKLNERTIPDRYPMPNISMILGNLGKAKYFTTLDLNAATIHSELSLTHTIPSTDKPLNCFQNQITLEEARCSSKRSFVLFGNKRRHNIDFSCEESLLEELADVIVPKGVNAIHCDFHTLAMVQDKLVRQFPATKFWHCKNRVIYICN
ncbi:hypothetical protein KR067_003410 [Drosophila pandora]|nr:hypothetical protein KR067_003410 [Drosophila pandora]